MEESLTLGGNLGRRTSSFITGVGMIVASIVTIKHFFDANYPVSIWEGSFCDISAFFNCDSSAFSSISQIGGVPLGYFGMMVGGLVALGRFSRRPDSRGRTRLCRCSMSSGSSFFCSTPCLEWEACVCCVVASTYSHFSALHCSGSTA